VKVGVFVGVNDGVALGVKSGSRQTGIESTRAAGSRVSPY
jgi:hypothetical protein